MSSTSLSFSKWKSYLPSIASSSENAKSKRRQHLERLDPEVGFKLQLVPSVSNSNYQSAGTTQSAIPTVPELNVQVIGARHLPVSFGLKSVEGYMIKVKMFPGTVRYDSNIQTSSWPKFNETFKFPMGSSTKSSFKRPKNTSVSQSLPERLFKGHFVVLTVFALLELPPNSLSGIKQKYHSIKRKGSLLLGDKKTDDATKEDKSEKSSKPDIMKLTTSESRRNIGSVTCFLDPKMFEENTKTGIFNTDELWLPIKDITVTPSANKNNSVTTSLKGQVEIILQLSDPEQIESMTALPDDDTISETSDTHHQQQQRKHSTSRSRWSLSDVRKKFQVTRKDKAIKGLALKITLSKMRCSIKVKEEFENVAGQIYIKITVFEHDILSNSWKTENFLPSLSTRWNPEDSTIIIPLPDESSLDNVSIKVSLATKTKIGKKIVLGTLFLGTKETSTKLEHWENMIDSRGTPVPMWHSFE